MFKENQPVSEPETIIGPSVKVEGDFMTEGDIIVEGWICGTIKTSKNLKVGAKSKIFANVSAENALISGEVQGNIKANHKIELTSTAKVFGDIKAEVVIVAAGSILNGRCQMGDGKTKSPRPEFSKQEKIELKPQEAAEKTAEQKKPIK